MHKLNGQLLRFVGRRAFLNLRLVFVVWHVVSSSLLTVVCFKFRVRLYGSLLHANEDDYIDESNPRSFNPNLNPKPKPNLTLPLVLKKYLI